MKGWGDSGYMVSVHLLNVDAGYAKDALTKVGENDLSNLRLPTLNLIHIHHPELAQRFDGRNISR